MTQKEEYYTGAQLVIELMNGRNDNDDNVV
jgi:hypothetical protein